MATGRPTAPPSVLPLLIKLTIKSKREQQKICKKKTREITTKATSTQHADELIKWQKFRVILSSKVACRFIVFELHLCEPACVMLAVHTQGKD
jgi:hypothetical protein